MRTYVRRPDVSGVKLRPTGYRMRVSGQTQEVRQKVDPDKDGGPFHRFHVKVNELLINKFGPVGSETEANREGQAWGTGVSGWLTDLRDAFEAGPSEHLYDESTRPSGWLTDLRDAFEAGPSEDLYEESTRPSGWLTDLRDAFGAGGAERLHGKHRGSRRKAYLVGTAIAAVAALAAFLAAGPGAGGDHREGREVPDRTVPSDTAVSAPPGDASVAQLPALPAADPVAMPSTTAAAQVPPRPFSGSPLPSRTASPPAPQAPVSPAPPSPPASPLRTNGSDKPHPSHTPSPRK